jgi:hypothetical protein
MERVGIRASLYARGLETMCNSMPQGYRKLAPPGPMPRASRALSRRTPKYENSVDARCAARGHGVQSGEESCKERSDGREGRENHAGVDLDAGPGGSADIVPCWRGVSGMAWNNEIREQQM